MLQRVIVLEYQTMAVAKPAILSCLAGGIVSHSTYLSPTQKRPLFYSCRSNIYGNIFFGRKQILADYDADMYI
jgi:hypothetical protein